MQHESPVSNHYVKGSQHYSAMPDNNGLCFVLCHIILRGFFEELFPVVI